MVAPEILGAHQAVTPGSVPPWYLGGGVALSNCLGAWLAKGAASYAASKVNLLGDPAYDLVDTAHVPDWAAPDGWDCDGVAEYLDTALVLTATCTLAVYVRDCTVGGTVLGCGKSGDAWAIQAFASYLAGDGWAYCESPEGWVNEVLPAGTITSGVFIATRQAGYRDGAAISETSGVLVDGGATLPSLLIGAYNNDGTPEQFFDGKIAAVAAYGIVFTPQQAKDLAIVMAAL
jgi:hypothetical protein